jgi:hypothetical protein
MQHLIYLPETAEFIERLFALERYTKVKRGGVYLPSFGSIKCLDLVL